MLACMLWIGQNMTLHDITCMQVRRKMVGKTEPSYSQYTCYTGIADFTPPDIDTVGYRVFLGNGKYFVSSDVGGGKMQWCVSGVYTLFLALQGSL